MAVGFSPKHVQDFNLNLMNTEHFLVLANEAALRLKWSVSFISEKGFIAYTKISWTSWSEEITVKIDNGIANIKSECTGSQMMD